MTLNQMLFVVKIFGVEDRDGKEVGIDRLMGNTFIKFSPNKYAIYITR